MKMNFALLKEKLKLASEVEKYKHLKHKVVREYYYLKSIKYTGNMYEHYLKYKDGNHRYAKDFEFLDNFIMENIYSNNEIASTFKCSIWEE